MAREEVLQRALLAALICLGAATLGARADLVQVGGSSGWGLGINYPLWAEQNPVYVGDVLFFVFPPAIHTVFALPNNQSLTACDFSNSTNLSQPNNSNVAPGLVGVNVPVSAPGPDYYACEVDGHCLDGMKVAINVLPGPRPVLAPAPAPGAGIAAGPSGA
ncbi:Cupredoxin superfamily protein [Klebsormidium nitens]|uniref:Cupredoxin superfamily protein n=1 Tax=Klebsormidium nitens TaxID=105231 RepID=A0A1Y1HQP1_KLENI|nr:Cupredoxin superfamily protein [Klebsormidium nitens]|eukprot:GAQ78148.1 Cupredoxin superfamily protein [Klebsormidium nitens]